MEIFIPECFAFDGYENKLNSHKARHNGTELIHNYKLLMNFCKKTSIHKPQLKHA